MDIRIRGLSGALMRRFAAKAGSRERERLIVAKLIEAYVEGNIDPLAEGDPVMAARGAQGGRARAANLTTEQRREAALRMVEARRAKRSEPTPT